MAKSTPKIDWHGPVGGNKPDTDTWMGHASAANYKHQKQTTADFKKSIPSYYRAVTLGAPVRCVEKRFSGIVGVLYDYVHDLEPSDELLAQVFIKPTGKFASKKFRGSDGLDHIASLAKQIKKGQDISADPIFKSLRQEVESEPLGPQTVGGTHAMAYSYRIAQGIEPGATIEQDISYLAKAEDNFKGGNHKDEKAVPPRIGCTAVDQDELILYRAASAFLRPENQRISRFLLGHSPNLAFERSVLLGFDRLNNPDFRDSYFMRTSKDHTHRQAGLDTLKKSSGTQTEIVVGGYEGAVFFLVNRVNGQTFHKNLWGLDMMGRGIKTPPGAYNYDIWRSIDRSKILFPKSEQAQRTFLKARCLYAASTLTVLCDGTLELGERK